MEAPLFHAFRLHAAEKAGDPAVWLSHEDWCETPDPMREPLTRDRCLELIAWDRAPGDRYCIRRYVTEPEDSE
jgi:hypothetical protein